MQCNVMYCNVITETRIKLGFCRDWSWPRQKVSSQADAPIMIGQTFFHPQFLPCFLDQLLSRREFYSDATKVKGQMLKLLPIFPTFLSPAQMGCPISFQSTSKKTSLELEKCTCFSLQAVRVTCVAEQSWHFLHLCVYQTKQWPSR